MLASLQLLLPSSTPPDGRPGPKGDERGLTRGPLNGMHSGSVKVASGDFGPTDAVDERGAETCEHVNLLDIVRCLLDHRRDIYVTNDLK